MHAVFETLRNLLTKVEESQAEAIRAAAKLVAECIANDGLIHIFGTGHSHMLAEELFYRAGGLVNVSPILDSGLMLHESALGSTDLERLEGYVALVLRRYTFSPHDIMVVVSNSGRNPGPIEAALEARRWGLPVIALTSLGQSRSSSSRHSSGKRLFELADVVLDNGGVSGDAALDIPGLPARVCPTSTIVGAALLHAMVYEATILLRARGQQPHILLSSNLDAAEDPRVVLARYRARIRHL